LRGVVVLPSDLSMTYLIWRIRHQM